MAPWGTASTAASSTACPDAIATDSGPLAVALQAAGGAGARLLEKGRGLLTGVLDLGRTCVSETHLSPQSKDRYRPSQNKLVHAYRRDAPLRRSTQHEHAGHSGLAVEDYHDAGA